MGHSPTPSDFIQINWPKRLLSRSGDDPHLASARKGTRHNRAPRAACKAIAPTQTEEAKETEEAETNGDAKTPALPIQPRYEIEARTHGSLVQELGSSVGFANKEWDRVMFIIG